MKRMKGFSLLEVMISIGIIVILMISVVTMMRSNFEMNLVLRDESIVTSKLSKVMTQVANDIEHAYVISSKDVIRNTSNRTMRTIFSIDRGNAKIRMTTMSYKRFRRGEKSSELVYVVYEVKKSPKFPGRSDLYRGVATVIPSDFKQDPKMELFAKGIKTFSVLPWNGEEFIKDRWDSENGDTADKLPKMVRVDLETWSNELIEDDTPDPEDDKKTEWLSSRLFLSNSYDFVELKTPLGTMSWN